MRSVTYNDENFRLFRLRLRGPFGLSLKGYVRILDQEHNLHFLRNAQDTPPNGHLLNLFCPFVDFE